MHPWSGALAGAPIIPPNDPSRQVNMDAMVEAFAKLGTTTVSDAMDRLGLTGQAFGIKPVDRSFKLKPD